MNREVEIDIYSTWGYMCVCVCARAHVRVCACGRVHVCMCACVCTQLYPTLCNIINCSLPVSSVHGIFQARIMAWVAISYSRGSSQPRDRTHVFCIAGRFFLPLHHLGRECEVSVEVCEVILFKSNWVLQQIVFSQSGPTNITPSHMPLF